MSGLLGSLNNSVKALNAQTRGVETAGRNLANVNNTEYARQRVVFGDRGTVATAYGPQSLGLEAMGIEQIRDPLLDKQVNREISLTSELEMLQDALDTAQAGLGQSVDRTSEAGSANGGASGISEAMSDFFNSFTSLASKPTDAGEKQTLIQKAMILAERFQLTDSRLVQVQNDMTSQIESDVESVNDLLASIADLNGQIGRFEINFEGGAVDLRDTRQAKLEELAKLMDFEIQPSAGGPGQIDIIVRDSSSLPVQLVTLGKAGSVALNPGKTDVIGTPPGGGSPTLSFSSGSIAGAFDARDIYLTDLRSQLDALAEQIVTSVNSAYSASGGNFFTAGGTTAGSISVLSTLNAANLAAGTGASGDNSIALAVAGVANQVFSTAGGDSIDGTLSQHYTKTITNFGQTLAGVNTRLSNQQTIEKLVKSQRDSVSGVSMDEEMADLMKFQRAFQASSRVVTTIDNLLDVIVNGLIR